MKKDNYTRSINCKLTEKQFEDFKKIREKSGKSISKLLRENLTFLLEYYK